MIIGSGLNLTLGLTPGHSIFNPEKSYKFYDERPENQVKKAASPEPEDIDEGDSKFWTLLSLRQVQK